jgi:hypothetical protein
MNRPKAVIVLYISVRSFSLRFVCGHHQHKIKHTAEKCQSEAEKEARKELQVERFFSGPNV